MLLATSVIISEQYPRQYWRPWDLCINSIWELQPWSKLSSPPIPPPTTGSVLTLWLQNVFKTINIAEGRGDSRNRLFQQHFQAFITGSLCASFSYVSQDILTRAVWKWVSYKKAELYHFLCFHTVPFFIHLPTSPSLHCGSLKFRILYKNVHGLWVY